MKPWFDYFDGVLGTILNTSDESLDVQISVAKLDLVEVMKFVRPQVCVFWVARRVASVVAFGFLHQNFWRQQEPMNGTLSF